VGNPLTREDLCQGFRRAGLAAGDLVLSQNSFKAFGGVVGGPKTVIEAILEVLTPEGTLIMPAFNSEDFVEKKRYSKRHTKPHTGILSVMLSEWPGVHRIYHPIHGFSLVGKRAAELASSVSNHTSFEAASMFGELHRRDGKIMLLGVNYGAGLSFFHYVEEVVGVPYRTFIDIKSSIEELDGSVQPHTLKYYGCIDRNQVYDLNKVQPALEDVDSIVTIQQIGSSTVKLMRAADVYDRLSSELRRNPNLVI
jgi:aminoglycoside 3-N-acetyltransferase